MPLDIGEVLEQGVKQTLTRKGLIFSGLFLATSLLNTVFSNSLMAGLEISPGWQTMTGMLPLTLGVSPVISGVLLLITSIALSVVVLAGFRSFVNKEEVEADHFTRNALFSVLNLWIGGLIFSLVVGIGLIFLIVPGIFLLVSLYFWSVFVAVEDENFFQAMKSSWGITRGNRLRLFAAGLLVVVATWIFHAVFNLPLNLAFGRFSTLVALASLVPSAITTTFTLAATSTAYNQLR